MEKQKFPREKFLWEPTQELVFVKYVGNTSLTDTYQR